MVWDSLWGETVYGVRQFMVWDSLWGETVYGVRQFVVWDSLLCETVCGVRQFVVRQFMAVRVEIQISDHLCLPECLLFLIGVLPELSRSLKQRDDVVRKRNYPCSVPVESSLCLWGPWAVLSDPIRPFPFVSSPSLSKCPSQLYGQFQNMSQTYRGIEIAFISDPRCNKNKRIKQEKLYWQ